MANMYDRRRFLKELLALAAAGAAVSACGSSTALSEPDSQAGVSRIAARSSPSASPQTTAVPVANSSPDAPRASALLAVVRGAGADPAELTRRAIAAVGGIERFVKPDSKVIVKPNICNAYHGPEYASTTNPQVVAAIVALCRGAGAKRVTVMDAPFGGAAQAAYVKSGIDDAVVAAGGEMKVMSRMAYRLLAMPNGRTLKEWNVYSDVLDADVLINVPIAKNHGSARLTLGMKNLMGVIQNRNAFHARGLHQCIADLSSGLRCQLTVIDAVRMLMENGPTGGNLDDVRQADTVIASTDIVAADAYATTLFGMAPVDIEYIRLAAEMGIGQMDLDAILPIEIAV